MPPISNVSVIFNEGPIISKGGDNENYHIGNFYVNKIFMNGPFLFFFFLTNALNK